MAVKLIIAGSRTVYPTFEQIDADVLRLPIWGDITPDIARIGEVVVQVIGGRSPGGGADDAGEAWAIARGLPFHPEPITDEDYRVHGKYLGPKMRNRRMANIADIALIYWNGHSGGSADICIRMQARGKPTLVIPIKSTRKPKRQGKRSLTPPADAAS